MLTGTVLLANKMSSIMGVPKPFCSNSMQWDTLGKNGEFGFPLLTFDPQDLFKTLKNCFKKGVSPYLREFGGRGHKNFSGLYPRPSPLLQLHGHYSTVSYYFFQDPSHDLDGAVLHS